MKLLFIAPYVYAPAYKEHRKNKTGFGFMVHDIAAGAGKQGDQVVLTTYAFGPERHCDGFSIAPNSLLQNIFHGRYQGLFRFCRKLRKAGTSFKGLLKASYYYLHIGYIRHLIKKEKPDVVHLHGCTTEIEELIQLLRELEVPYAITLHGLLQDDRGASQHLKNCELAVIRDESNPITVISSKMKERFLSDYYSAANTDHVQVITNGVDVKRREASYDIRAKHGIPADKKIILTVGSICALKNQNQTARAFASMPKELRDQCVLLLAGTVHENSPVLEEIQALGLDDQILCLGFVPREELGNYYHAADLTITASVTEGFGLPMIEGFVYGVPCVAFADLDAISDIYDECAMHLCKERNDEALASAIDEALSRNWDQDAITTHSIKFSLEAMAKKYQTVYKELLQR